MGALTPQGIGRTEELRVVLPAGNTSPAAIRPLALLRNCFVTRPGHLPAQHLESQSHGHKFTFLMFLPPQATPLRVLICFFPGCILSTVLSQFSLLLTHFGKNKATSRALWLELEL